MQISDLDSLLPALNPLRFVFGESARGESLFYLKGVPTHSSRVYHHKKSMQWSPHFPEFLFFLFRDSQKIGKKLSESNV